MPRDLTSNFSRLEIKSDVTKKLGQTTIIIVVIIRYRRHCACLCGAYSKSYSCAVAGAVVAS